MLNQSDSDMYLKAMFGINARQAAGQIFLQNQGKRNGQPVTAFVGYVNSELRLPKVVSAGYVQQLVIGEVIIRPQLAFTGNNHLGEGLDVTGWGMWPAEWDYQLTGSLLENLVKNPYQS